MFVGMLNAFNFSNRTGTRIRAYKSFGIFTIGAATLDEFADELYTRTKKVQALSHLPALSFHFYIDFLHYLTSLVVGQSLVHGLEYHPKGV